MELENTILYKEMVRRLEEIPSLPPNILEEFKQLAHVLQQHGKYIVRIFPEYTPHDSTLHLDHLFGLADRLLGAELYSRLNATELVVFAFALYSHDWGMAVSEAELRVLRGEEKNSKFMLLPNEPEVAQTRLKNNADAGMNVDESLIGYIRDTHGNRSGMRLRKQLEHIGSTFSEAVARAAEGHTLDIRDIRNVKRYPYTYPIFGHVTNLAAICAYVRIVDILDIGEDRTPYALWKFVAPQSTISSIEWKKHRALSAVAVVSNNTVSQVLVEGSTDDVDVYAALHDLKEWVSADFSSSLAIVRNYGGGYDLPLDSKIQWSIEAKNFKPIMTKFTLEREPLLGLLSKELYGDEPYAFLRELLQNSVDAIDTREEVLRSQNLRLEGTIDITIRQEDTCLHLEWTDNGIGMDESILQSYFSSIGRSWYKSKAFTDLHLGHDPVSQFGLGILSCFSVSNTLTIETRREPCLCGSQSGLSVQIPNHLAHFRVKESENIPIGTKIVLEIQDPKAKYITPEGIRKYLSRMAGYLRHKVTISIDGQAKAVKSLAGWDPSSANADIGRNPALIIQGLNADPKESVLKHATVHTFPFGKTGGDYEGYYSAIFPNAPSEMTYDNYHEWSISGTRFDSYDHFDNSAREVFVKGVLIKTSMDFTKLHEMTDLTGACPEGEWYGPKIAVNLPKASWFQVNLSRSDAKVIDQQWRTAMWQEIAGQLKAGAFANYFDSLESTAMALGIAHLFGGVPFHALKHLVSCEDTPLLVLRANEGLVWEKYGTLMTQEPIINAPFELNYTLDNDTVLAGFGLLSGLGGWSGVDTILTSDSHASFKRFPWLQGLLSYAHILLEKDGYLPTNLLLVESPANETIPLCVRVWNRIFEKDQAPDWTDSLNLEMQLPENSPLERHPSVLRSVLRDDSPFIVRFPDCIAEYACFGSRYWNALHPKTYPIVSAFLELKERVNNGQTSDDTHREYRFITSSNFIGYVIPSRSSSTRTGLEVQSRLVELVKREGIAVDLAPFVIEDSYPGTIGTYLNPYHYDLSSWKQGGTELRKPFSPGAA